MVAFSMGNANIPLQHMMYMKATPLLSLDILQSHTAQELLLLKANPNRQDALGRTWLHHSICNEEFSPQQRCRIIELLITDGTNPDLADKEGATPLHYSVIYNRLECTETLLKYNATPDISTCEHGLTPLHIAVSENHRYIALALLSWGANPDITCAEGWTARARLPADILEGISASRTPHAANLPPSRKKSTSMTNKVAHTAKTS
jgi:ankyrin repeat protein